MQRDGVFVAVSDTEGAMAAAIRRSILQARQHLIQTIRGLDNGFIENLHVEDGEPLFDPLPSVVKTIAVDSGTDPTPARADGDDALEEPIERLFRLFDQYGSLRVIRLDVQDGRLCLLELLGLSRRPAGGDQCCT